MEVSTTFRGMMPSEPLLAAVRRHCSQIVGLRLCETVLVDEGHCCTVTVHVETDDGCTGAVRSDPDAFLAVSGAFGKVLETSRARNPAAYCEAAQ